MRTNLTRSPKVSVLIANYNNSFFLERCIKSVENQNYKNKEIIVVDDQSSDNSLRILERFKNRIILIKNKKEKFNITSYDQINTYKIALNNSSGKIIFFLDSDDFFSRNKLKEIVNYFIKNKNENIVMDKPITFFNKKKKFKFIKKSRNTFFTPWPRFSPQSCICVDRNYLSKIYKIIAIKKFPTVCLDFRIITFSFIKYKKVNIINKFLTFYQQSENSASAIYQKKFSKNWWLRRKDAHSFFNYANKKINNRKYYSADFFITKIFNYFLKK
jgi:glycosyltransferase involved in cell wall biosynthesis